MLQYPINVKPENYAIDASKSNRVSFDFKGDFLSGVHYVFRDYDTDEIIRDFYRYEDDFTPIRYNNEELSSYDPLPSYSLANGRNYTLQMMLVQRTQDGSQPLYDMPVLSGVIGIGETGQTQILIANDITSIYEWGESEGAYYPTKIGDDIFGGMVIKIGNETREILKYEPSIYSLAQGRYYGRLTLNSAFSGVTTGKPYQIYSNYLITPQYYFTCRATPSVSLTHTCYSNYFKCKGTFSQSDNSKIKYYTLKLYWANNPTFIKNDETGALTKFISETGKVYSQNIDVDFLTPYYHDKDYKYETTDYYKIICEIVTQDNMVYTADDYTFALAPEDYSGVVGNTTYEFSLDWDRKYGAVTYVLRGYNSTGVDSTYVRGDYELFRTDLDTGEIFKLVPELRFYVPGFCGYIDDGIGVKGIDYTASTHGNYKYTLYKFDSNGKIIVPVKLNEGVGEFPSGQITTNENAYYIYELTVNPTSLERIESGELNNVQFTVGDIWTFICDIEDTTVTNNLDRQTHVGYGKYISSTSTNTNYMSGTLSAMIGTLDCLTKTYNDTIAIVNAWRKFITQEKPFLLKSQKGDVWIVNVVDNPTTEYDESSPQIPTRFSFSWAESYNVNDVQFFQWGLT